MRWTRSRVPGGNRPLPLRACDTVVAETPAAAATSLIPTLLRSGTEADHSPLSLDMEKRFCVRCPARLQKPFCTAGRAKERTRDERKRFGRPDHWDEPAPRRTRGILPATAARAAVGGRAARGERRRRDLRTAV